jgi:hypothetical protein
MKGGITMRIGRIKSDYIGAKQGIRELINTITPENNASLDILLKQLDELVQNAINTKVKQDGF